VRTGSGDVPPPAGERGEVDTDGVPVAWERWPAPGAPPVVLVHGTSAHSAWWHHTVPALTDAYDVTALDLSGHGDSGRRPSYSMAGWADEVLAVVAALHGGPALLVGHSIGGLVAAGAAARAPDAVAAVVLVDSVVDVPPEPPPGADRPRGARVYDSVEDAVARFRLEPPQPVAGRTVLDYVATRSVRPVPDGWGWKVDGRIYDVVGAQRARLVDGLAGVRCPAAVVRGERSSLVGADAAGVLARRWGRPVPQYTVPGAHHHVMLDEDAAFGRILRTALDDLPVPAARAGVPAVGTS
jgi:pimeloyl-ACP methyl ester carboxylesterase